MRMSALKINVACKYCLLEKKCCVISLAISGRQIEDNRLTHEEIGQVLDHGPLRIHWNMVFVCEQPTHMRDAHPFVDQEAFTAAVQRKRFDEELLYARLAHLLQRQADFLCLRFTRCIWRDNYKQNYSRDAQTGININTNKNRISNTKWKSAGNTQHLEQINEESYIRSKRVLILNNIFV